MTQHLSLPARLQHTIRINGMVVEDAVDAYLRLLDDAGLRLVSFNTGSRATIVGTVTDGKGTYIARMPVVSAESEVTMARLYAAKGIGPRVHAVHGDLIVMERVCADQYLEYGDVSGSLGVISAAGCPVREFDTDAAVSFHQWLDHRVAESESRESLHEDGSALVETARTLRDVMKGWDYAETVRHGDLSVRNIITDSRGGMSIIDSSPVIGPVEVDAIKLFRSQGIHDSELYAHFDTTVLKSLLPFYTVTGVLYIAAYKGVPPVGQ